VPPYLAGSARQRASQRQARAPTPRAIAARNAAAAAGVAAVVAQLALAQATLLFTLLFAVTGALGRWRRPWLLAPALAGLAWAAVIGPGRAWAGYVAGAGHLVGGLAGLGHAGGVAAVTAEWRRWLPRQVPLALIVGAAQASVVLRFGLRGSSRPGLIVAIRRGYLQATMRRGEIATADGGCLGVQPGTGRRVGATWREAAAGVLVAGADAAAVTGTCIDLASAAIAHRKAVIVVDLAGGPAADAIVAAGRRAAAPVTVFGQGRACYEPSDLEALLRQGSPAGRSAGEARITAGHEIRTEPFAAQLTALRRSPAGRLICAASPGEQAIDLARALAGRQVVVFPLDRRLHDRAGIMIARLVLADLARVLAGRAGVPADGLIWIHGCEAIGAAELADLARGVPGGGMATMLSTTSSQAAACLAEAANVVVIRGRPPPGLARHAQARAGQPGAHAGYLAGSHLGPNPRSDPADPARPADRAAGAGASWLDNQDGDVLPAGLLAADGADALSLLVREPVRRLERGRVPRRDEG
jgi:hypothetical protein